MPIIHAIADRGLDRLGFGNQCLAYSKGWISMLSLADGQLRMLFDQSNILRFDYDKYLGVLDATLKEHHLAASDVLAVSETMGLVIVVRTGIVRSHQRGVFNKRAEVGPLISYESMRQVVTEQRQPRGRESWIKCVGANSKSVAEIGWSAGGSVDIPDAARERDRVYEVIVRAARAAV